MSDKKRIRERELEEEIKGNFIAVGSEVIVHSDRSSLSQVEDCVNRLIRKHKNLITFKRRNKLMTGIS